MTEPDPMAGLLTVVETIMPLFETATGLRVRLEKEGWSSHAAEAIALEVALSLFRKALG